MAYDLEEQEQLAQLKAWWQKYGNAILSAVTVVLLGFASYNGWRWYEREQAKTAAGVYGQLEQAIESRDAAKVPTSRPLWSRPWVHTTNSVEPGRYSQRATTLE